VKMSVLAIGAVASFLASSLALAAPPAHEGYPYGGKGGELYGQSAEREATEAANKEFLGGYPNELKSAEDNSRLGIQQTNDPRHPAHPGYPYRDQTANTIPHAPAR